MRSKKYRIIKDKYLGFECQVWHWYWPFWRQIGFSNTHSTIEDAVRYIEGARNLVVKEL